MTNRFFRLTGFIIAFVTLAATTAFSAVAPPSSQTVTLAWDYPADELETDLTFKVYHTTDLSVPVANWTVLTNVVGTNRSTKLVLGSGAHFYALTASNTEGESDFATVSP